MIYSNYERIFRLYEKKKEQSTYHLPQIYAFPMPNFFTTKEFVYQTLCVGRGHHVYY